MKYHLFYIILFYFVKYGICIANGNQNFAQNLFSFLKQTQYENTIETKPIRTCSVPKYIKSHAKPSKLGILKWMGIRGGRSSSDENESTTQESTLTKDQPINVLVSTSIGSSFLDKKKKLTISHNSTVYDLKVQIHQKFPGSPPIDLQRLYFGVRPVHDHEVVRNISTMPVIPILLDMISGTSVYSKTLSVTQTIEAYVATVVQQAYLGDSMRALFNADVNSQNNTSNSNGSLSEPETSYYREMFQRINQSIYEKYTEDINLALEEESEPETIAVDTIAWRGQENTKSSLVKSLAKEFDLNGRGLRSFAYYSAVIGFFAWYGTNGDTSANILLTFIPMLWISKLRQLRLIFKIILYLGLPVISKLNS